ncbi:MAG: ATP-binding cassette domain-containing protein [Candidatus Krumholzibacteria bacterium]|nr:ATP-binding cassette domain-containing protein [Candidatus Krumholzibacteria bacterium]
MIEVRKLSKNFGPVRAVQDLSFTVEQGEILGLLGPNGAGKTTTMKILTCYLPPSSGSATVLGYNTLRDSMEVRRRIGYLPEKNPLYYDMRVEGYLSFVARLKGVDPAGIDGAVGNAIDRCGLDEVRRFTIGTLSKGYQQRVGIAQAIVNDPRLLILDEPTIGLDPRQIVDIRNLIRELGNDRTVILSSHILPEVSQVCDRIIIINRGRLVAVDSPENLRDRLRRSSMTRVRLRDASARESAESLIGRIEGVLMTRGEAGDDGGAVLVVESAPDRDLREEIARRIVGAGLPLLEIYSEELSLEDIFIRLVTEEEH